MNIGILGGGVGGLSTAIALKQEGFEVTVYERHNKTSEIGAGIVCWPNASFILEQLGVLDKIAKVSGEICYMNRYTQLGESIGQLDINELNRLMKYPSYSILRKDLIKILTQRSHELNINIQYGHDVVNIVNEQSNAVVKFSNGNTIKPDVVIGADGRMKSLARKYVNGSNSPIYQGFINWIGVFEGETESFSELSVSDYWGVGKRFGIVPVSHTKAYWAGGAISKKINDLTPSKYKSELSSLFSYWPDIITKVINGTPQSRINKIYVHDHDPIDLWHKDNLILLGDAAHSPLPTSGQGACQALEDAWHLTKSLKNSGGNIEQAFTLFNALRKSKTAGMIMGGRKLASSIFNNDAEFCKQRDIASKNTNYQHVVTGMAHGWSSGLPLGG